MATATTDSTRYAPLLSAAARRPLSRDEERRVARRYKETADPEALRRLVESNQHFVIMVARQYQNMGLPLEDLVSEGNVGLLQAATRFDPEKGIKFITYAVWWIRRALLQALSDQSRLVRLPKYKVRQVRNLRDRIDELRADLGREPTLDDVAHVTGKSRQEVEDMLCLGSFEASIDAEPLGADGPSDTSPYDRLLSHDTLEGDYHAVEVRRMLQRAIGSLNPKEQHVILRRFGFIEARRDTLEAVSKELGLTKERVRQIELQAKGRLRDWFRARREQIDVVDGVPC